MQLFHAYSHINFTQRLSSDKTKTFYAMEWGRSAGQRITTGVFTYVKPKDQIQKNHNKEALMILEMKRSQMILDSQAISSGYIPQHKIKSNFLDYYTEFVKLNSRKGNQHLSQSLEHLNVLLEKIRSLQ